MTSAEGSDPPVEVLRRWQDFGAVWRVVARTPTSLEVALLTCTGGEEVDRLVSSDPELRAYIGDRMSSEDTPPADVASASRDEVARPEEPTWPSPPPTS